MVSKEKIGPLSKKSLLRVAKGFFVIPKQRTMPLKSVSKPTAPNTKPMHRFY